MTCESAACIHVEVAANDKVHIWADSDSDTSEFASATREEWAAFVAGVKAGDFDNLGDTDA